jgi:hypothetical protein
LWQSVKAPRGASAKSGTRKATPRKPNRTNGNDAGEGNPPTTPPPAAALTEEQMRAAYFQLLLRKAESDDSDSMLDRIELLVGLAGDKKPNRGRKTAGSKPATPTDPASQVEE